MPSTLVGKKAAHIVGNSESDNEIVSLGSSTDDKEILECLLNLPCLSCNKNRKRNHTKRRKGDNPLTTTINDDGTIYLCDSNVEHCSLNLPEDMVEDKPLDLENINEKQNKDDDLSQSLARHPTWYISKNISDVNDILCYTKPGNSAANWKIVLPRDLIRPSIMWYHQVTGYLGSKRLYQHTSTIL